MIQKVFPALFDTIEFAIHGTIKFRKLVLPEMTIFKMAPKMASVHKCPHIGFTVVVYQNILIIEKHSLCLILCIWGQEIKLEYLTSFLTDYFLIARG